MRRRAEAVALRHRRWAGLCVVLALLGGVAGWVEVMRDRATPVPLATAVARFRAGERPAGRPAVPVAAARSKTAAAGAVSAAVGSTAPAAGNADPAVAAGPPGPTALGAKVRPESGVYTYRTEGWDEISILGGRHDYPDETHATITHAAGCRWDVEHPLVEEHVEREERCTDATAFRLIADGSEIEYFAQRDRGGFRCDPALVLAVAGDPVGTRRRATCPGDGGGDDEADFTVTVRGPTTVPVDERAVDAVHVTIDVRMRGRADGTARADVWLHERTGLPLRVVRRVDTAARSLFGDVHYRERLRLELRSLTPTR